MLYRNYTPAYKFCLSSILVSGSHTPVESCSKRETINRNAPFDEIKKQCRQAFYTRLMKKSFQEICIEEDYAV